MIIVNGVHIRQMHVLAIEVWG